MSLAASGADTQTDPPQPVGYWLQLLEGAVPIRLPADRRRDPATPATVRDVEIPVPAGTVTAIRRYCDEHGTTPCSVFLAALLAVLHRHTGERDLLVGLPTMDTAVRTVVEPAGPFTGLVDQVHRASATARARAGVPLSRVMRMPEPGRDLSHLMAVTFAYLDASATGNGFDPAPGQHVADLGFTVTEAGGATLLGVRYNAAVFGYPTAARLLRHCATLLAEAVRAPDRPAAAVPVEAGSPPRQPWPLSMPSGYAPPRPAGPDESLVDRFRTTVTAHGARLAVRGASGAYTYAELDRVTEDTAVRYRRVMPDGGRIALLCEHDVGSVVGVWSALKAGAGYVPLDPRHPDGRLTQILSDAAVAAVSCDARLVARATALAAGAPVVPLAPVAPEVFGTDPPLPAVASDTLAYLLHTSGSTGRPKGVMQTQRNVLAHALTYATRLRIGPDDRIPLLSRYTFDAAVMDLFGALLAGASLHLVDPYQQDARALWSSLAELGASILHCTPTLFRHLAAAAKARADTALSSVRAVVLGGEEATHSDLRDFARALPSGCVLVNGYGPTECTMALQHLVRPSDKWRPTVPIGHPVEGVDAYLVDDRGQVTEVLGELVLRSRHVAAGYWNRPEDTERAFGTEPAGTDPEGTEPKGTHPDGTACYRTGDVAYRLPDGAFLFRGRKDHQVKIRGHRVEPAEAEALLRAHPTVGKAAVVVDQRGECGPQLVGYVTSPAPMPADPDELVAYLGRHLPDYLVPSHVMVLDALPVGPTGKLDRSRLPAPVERSPVAAGDRPQTPLEQAIAGVWCEILGRESVGLRDNFVSLGGDSLQIMTLLGRLGDHGIDMSLLEFLTAPTIEAIVKHQVARA